MTTDLFRVLEGTEASRRVGWARYYAERGQRERAEQIGVACADESAALVMLLYVVLLDVDRPTPMQRRIAADLLWVVEHRLRRFGDPANPRPIWNPVDDGEITREVYVGVQALAEERFGLTYPGHTRSDSDTGVGWPGSDGRVV